MPTHRAPTWTIESQIYASFIVHANAESRRYCSRLQGEFFSLLQTHSIRSLYFLYRTKRCKRLVPRPLVLTRWRSRRIGWMDAINPFLFFAGFRLLMLWWCNFTIYLRFRNHHCALCTAQSVQILASFAHSECSSLPWKDQCPYSSDIKTRRQWNLLIACVMKSTFIKPIINYTISTDIITAAVNRKRANARQTNTQCFGDMQMSLVGKKYDEK